MSTGDVQARSLGPEETRRLGYILGKALRPGDRLALMGPLGAGKTHFIQGVAEGMECDEGARSPSYVLVNAYTGRCPLYHCDWYRLDSDDDVISTGFEDLMADAAVVAVEWADKHIDLLGTPRIDIEFKCGNEQERLIAFRSQGADHLRPVLHTLGT